MASFDQTATVVASEDFEKQNRPEDLALALEDEPPGPNARPAVFRSTAQEILFIFTATIATLILFQVPHKLTQIPSSIGPDAPQGWKTPYVLVFIVLGLLMIAVFVWWEGHFPSPLMQMKIWRDKEFSILLTILLLGFTSFPALFFFASLYLQELFGYSALITAVCLLPTAVGGVTVNVHSPVQAEHLDSADQWLKFLAGRSLHRVSNKFMMGLGAAAFTISFLLVAVQRTGASYWAFTFPALAIVTVGTDLEFNVVNMYVVSALPKSQQSIASSVFQTTIKFATTIGLGVCTAIFTSVSNNPAATGYYAHDSYEPYAALFWFAMTLSFTSLCLVPFLKIKTQGLE